MLSQYGYLLEVGTDGNLEDFLLISGDFRGQPLASTAIAMANANRSQGLNLLEQKAEASMTILDFLLQPELVESGFGTYFKNVQTKKKLTSPYRSLQIDCARFILKTLVYL